MALQERPFATIAELAERVGISRPTMKKKIEFLEGKGAQPLFYVYPNLNYEAMRLEQVDLILDVNSFEDVQKLVEIARKHPYTSYRSRCYGAFNGVFLQFRVPIGTAHYIKELVDTLNLKGRLRNHLILESKNEKSIYTSMSVDVWNQSSMSWKFDWELWFESSAPLGQRRRKKVDYNIFDWLKKDDLYILQQLMLNARRSNRVIIDALRSKGIDFTPQTFGRRLRLVQRDCIDGYRVTFDPQTFDIISNVLILGNADEKFLAQLQAKMTSDPIPFESSFRTSDNHLFWFVRLSPSHLSLLIERLHPHLDNMYVTMIDYRHSKLFSIWPDIYDPETKTWRQDEKFMLHDVLK